MTTQSFEADLAAFAAQIAEGGLAPDDGTKTIAFRIPEEAFPRTLEALGRASAEFGTPSGFTTLWALLEPFLGEDPG